MSNIGISMTDTPSTGGKSPRRQGGKKRSGAAIVVAIVLSVGILGGLAFVLMTVMGKLADSAPAADYPGPGTTEVVVEVSSGQNLTQIGSTLEKAKVVASTQAFYEAAVAAPDATSITPGSYVMLEGMAAVEAVDRLLNPQSRNENIVVIQEGLRTDQTLKQLSDVTGVKVSAFKRVIPNPALLKLPDWAKGTGESRAEGFLFPATYTFEKSMSAEQILNLMVARFNEVAEKTDFVAEAKKTGYNPYEVLTIASLIQAEGTGKDYPEISGALYNRLDPDRWGGTYGLLQVDATVNYIFKKSVLNFKDDEKDSNSPYNTYKFAGLPPTPINSPGEAAIEAAISPKKSKIIYWLHKADGKTCYATNYRDHINNDKGSC